MTMSEKWQELCKRKTPRPIFFFSGQRCLVSSEVTGVVQTVVYENWANSLRKNPSVQGNYRKRPFLLLKPRKAAQKARELSMEAGILECGGLL